MIPELRDHILSFLSSDSLLPPSLLELSKLLQRPTLDLVVLRREDASPHVCSYEGFVYTGPMWNHPQRAAAGALAGVHRLSSDVPGTRRVHGHHQSLQQAPWTRLRLGDLGALQSTASGARQPGGR